MTVMNAVSTETTKAYPGSIAQWLDRSESGEESMRLYQRAMVVKWREEQGRAQRHRELAQFAVTNVLEDLIGQAGTVFYNDDCAVGLVLHGAKKELDDEAMETFATFVSCTLAKFTKVRATIGVGSLMHTFMDLNRSLVAALQAVDRSRSSEEPDTHPFVEEAKRLLRQDCGDGVCLKTIAKQLYVNPAYLGRLFKTYQSVTFNEYLIHVRMEKAKELLKTTDMKIYEIAHEIGYRQLDWFYKKFKAYAGCSAKEFKGRRM